MVVNPTVGTAGNNVAVQATSVRSEKSAVLPGTTFKTAGVQVVDPAVVAMVVAPATAKSGSGRCGISGSSTGFQKTQVINFTGRNALSLTDRYGNLNVVNNVTGWSDNSWW